MPHIPSLLRCLLVLLVAVPLAGISVSAASGLRKDVVAVPGVDLVGTWSGQSKGESGVFVFKADGRADLIMAGKSIRDQLPPGADIHYEVDGAATPMHLDLVLSAPNGSEAGRLLMIFEVVDARTIRVRTRFDAVRPAGFAGGSDSDTILLTKSE